MNNKNDLSLSEAALIAKIARKDSLEADCEIFWDEESFKSAKKQMNLLLSEKIDIKNKIIRKMKCEESVISLEQNRDKIIGNAQESLYGYFAAPKVIDKD